MLPPGEPTGTPMVLARPVRPARVPRRLRWLVAGAGAAFLMACATPVVLGELSAREVDPAVVAAPAPTTVSIAGRPFPVARAADPGAVPLGTPAPLAAVSDSWRPSHTREEQDGGGPVRFDPCRPVRFVVNPTGMPEGGRDVLDAALARVSAATGLQFVDAGTTTETDRTWFSVPELYGPGYAPVLLRWDLPAAEIGDGVVLGHGGPMLVTPIGGDTQYVTGTAGLTAAGASYPLQTPWGRTQMQAVWMHELAHLVGLDHVEDPSQLMNPNAAGVTDFAAGDLTGLAALGTGPCLG